MNDSNNNEFPAMFDIIIKSFNFDLHFRKLPYLKIDFYWIRGKRAIFCHFYPDYSFSLCLRNGNCSSKKSKLKMMAGKRFVIEIVENLMFTCR